MSPQPTIAHYRISAKLGAGGMGEVWRATDTKLNRELAITIVPEPFAYNADLAGVKSRYRKFPWTRAAHRGDGFEPD